MMKIPTVAAAALGSPLSADCPDALRLWLLAPEWFEYFFWRRMMPSPNVAKYRSSQSLICGVFVSNSGFDLQNFQSALDAFTKGIPKDGLPKTGTPPVPPPPPVVRGLWYNNKIIKVDGWNFENCRFDKCLFVAESPYFSFKDCFIDSTNAVEFQGALVNVFQLSESVPIKVGIEALKPHVNADGTVSIGIANGA